MESAVVDMTMASAADSFHIGDIVFAQKYGYIPWPGKLMAKHSRAGLVQFMRTNDSHRIPYGKIWPYNEETKSLFVTPQNLDYEQFREAIYITERILGVTEDSIINAVLEMLNPMDEEDEEAEEEDDEVEVEEAVAEAEAEASPPKAIVSPTEVSTPAPPSQEQMELRFLHQVRGQRDTLDVELPFIGHINILRNSLTVGKQNYQAAQAAFLALLQLPISQLLLVRNYEAVHSIRQLCRFAAACYDSDELSASEVQQESQLVRDYARQLFARFAGAFQQPFSQGDFWSEYCMLAGIYRRYTKSVAE